MDSQLIYTRITHVDSTHCDRWGRMRPASLLEVLQEAAGDHAQALGVGRDRLESQDLFWAVVRQTVEIQRLPCMGETLVTETWPGPPSRTAFPRYLAGRTEKGEPLFRAVALWLFMNRHSRAMVLPEASGIHVPSLLRGGELTNPAGIASRDYPNVEKRTVRYSELDCNGHLSNTKYLNWMDDLLPSAFHRDNCLSRLHICYQNEALEGQEIALNWALEGNLLSLEGRRDQAPHRVFALRVQYRRL